MRQAAGGGAGGGQHLDHLDLLAEPLLTVPRPVQPPSFGPGTETDDASHTEGTSVRKHFSQGTHLGRRVTVTSSGK